MGGRRHGKTRILTGTTENMEKGHSKTVRESNYEEMVDHC
jgi:hypothetical protein